MCENVCFFFVESADDMKTLYGPSSALEERLRGNPSLPHQLQQFNFKIITNFKQTISKKKHSHNVCIKTNKLAQLSNNICEVVANRLDQCKNEIHIHIKIKTLYRIE